ncbi:hypothetical protein [Enterococcus villorum]|nr:hypothetical protein [Enterococcus villorum]EOH89968.1 hypothetical protein UAO_01212 [Enterococcus villorum ATCC 700913]EOW78200.1 hypothetical protein I591_01055 [Enterococcus villorum ATCC 700913]
MDQFFFFTKVPEAINIIMDGGTIQIAEEKGEDTAKKWHPDLSSLSQNISSAKSKAKEKTQINQNMDFPKTTNTKLYKSRKYREKR